MVPPPDCTCGYFMSVDHKASKNKSSFYGAKVFCLASKLPADECVKLGKFPRNSFFMESSSCEILHWKNDLHLAG